MSRSRDLAERIGCKAVVIFDVFELLNHHSMNAFEMALNEWFGFN